MKKNAGWFGFVFLVASFSFSGVTFGQWSVPDENNNLHTYNPYLFMENLGGGTSSRFLFRAAGSYSGRIYQEDSTTSGENSHLVIAATQNVSPVGYIALRNSDSSYGDKDVLKVYRSKMIIPDTQVCIGCSDPLAGYWLRVGGGTRVDGSLSVVYDVAIGPTFLSGYKLTVDGKIACEELKVQMIPADYVFEDGYPLMPLNVLEQKVKAEKHLPGIPSASEVTKNGVNVSQMQSKLLEKVEELTLYVIQLKKENDQLKARVAQLEKR